MFNITFSLQFSSIFVSNYPWKWISLKNTGFADFSVENIDVTVEGRISINIFYLGHEIMICEEPWIIFYFLISIAVIALMNPQSYNTTGLSTPMWGALFTRFISVFWNNVCIHSFLHIIGRRLGIRFLHSFLQIVQKISRNSYDWLLAYDSTSGWMCCKNLQWKFCFSSILQSGNSGMQPPGNTLQPFSLLTCIERPVRSMPGLTTLS